jgi:hypothetical protein
MCVPMQNVAFRSRRSHASVATTERYIHHTLAELSKAAAVLESGGVFDPLSDPKVGGGFAASEEAADKASVEGSSVH